MEGQNMPGLIEIFESSLRSVIISCGLQFMTFQCVDMAVFRQKKRWPAYLYMLFKTFVMSASLMIAENRPEFLVPNMIIQVVCTIGVLLAFVWTWSDDPLHVILIMTVSEILITFPALCVPVLVNLLEGRAASDRVCYPTLYAKAQGAWSYKNGKGSCWWLLRSPGYNSGIAANVYFDGSVYYIGYIVANDNISVRPALWIDLGS